MDTKMGPQKGPKMGPKKDPMKEAKWDTRGHPYPLEDTHIPVLRLGLAQGPRASALWGPGPEGPSHKFFSKQFWLSLVFGQGSRLLCRSLVLGARVCLM